ncbi:coiled-coil domain-containing protein mad1 [Apophysomyces ossiformis]|uniref:Spindle assembly checkpoint component MAD1 n=1 Tax=Apophysomyces ossiformis TaxID=679940 RepID=A0A8H7ENT0_9FUNG|nr:coiled-coil domain-containing protein mad1 [Apophysomyces ossiformis]
MTEEAQERAIYQMEKSQEATSTLQLMKDEHIAVADKLRDTVEELRNQNEQLSESLDNANKALKNAESEKENVQVELNEKIAELKGSVELWADSAKTNSSSFLTTFVRKVELREKLEEAEQKLKEIHDAQVDTAVLRSLEEQIQSQGHYMLEVELENKKLHREIEHYKSTQRSIDKLQEEIHSLRQQLSDAQLLRETNTKLEAENAELKTERNEWAQYLGSQTAFASETPRTIIAKLTRERDVALAKEGEIERLGLELQSQHQFVSELQATLMGRPQVQELKKKILESTKTHHSDVVALELVSKDRDMMKKHVKYLEDQLEFYNMVETNYMEGYDQQKTQRIAELEKLLKEFEDMNAAQTQQILTLQAALKEQTPIIDEAQTEEAAEQGQRILTLKENAVSKEFGIRKQQLDDLQAENSLLLKQVENLQSGEASEESIPDDLLLTVPKQTLENLKSESHSLQELVAKRDKRIVRLTKVWRDKVSEYKETVKKVLGYGIDFEESGAVRLVSDAEEQSNLSFIYRPDIDGQAMLEVKGLKKHEYMQDLESSYTTFVINENNIPAFLSSVTLELPLIKK